MQGFTIISPVTMVLAILVVIFLVLAFIKRRGSSKIPGEEKLRSLPGPRGLPLLGSSHIIGRYKKHSDAFSDLRKQYGEVYGITLGSRYCCVVSSIELIKEVLVTKCNDFANRPDFLRFHAIFRGDRNFSIALCDWSGKQKTRREIAFPFMHPKAKTLNMGRMNEHITFELKELVVELSKVCNQTLDARPFLLFATGNIFFQFLCSKRFSSDDKNFLSTVKIYDLVFRELFQGFAIDFMPWLKHFSQKKLKELESLASQVSDNISPIFEEHESEFDPEKPPKDLVDIFLHYLHEKKSDDSSSLTKEDAEVIIEDLIGGHSVLGNLWLWGLYLLAVNPEVKKAIRDEVSRVTQNCRAPSLEDKHNMPYSEATTYELLRCIASPIIPHVATKDTTIQDYSIPKDTMIMFNTYDINMDPQLWAEPRKFKPERFISDSGHVIKPDYFLPFGTGKRTCLGDGLVKSTLFLGLSTLLQNFDIELPEGAPAPSLYDIPGIVVPQNEILLTFKRLDNTNISVPLCTKIEMV